MNDLKDVFENFETDGEFQSACEFASGTINRTFFVETSEKRKYILQQMNANVFPDIPALIKNKILVSKHLAEKRAHLTREEKERRVLTFVQTNEGEYFVRDEMGNYWILSVYVADSRSYDTTPDEKIAFEAGKLFSGFLDDMSDFDASQLAEVIPDFHKMSHRFEQFDAALAKARGSRLNQASEQIKFARANRNEMHAIERASEAGEIRFRVTHNDTKISNALFSKETGEGLCVIDTDTVMKGIVHFDFGDAVRSICNTSAEDAIDSGAANFNIEYFKSFAEGFLPTLGKSLSSKEIELLGTSARVMTFIVGLRMLTDFLQDDTYFKTDYGTHNLVRAKTQFKLVEEIDKNLAEMTDIVAVVISNND